MVGMQSVITMKKMIQHAYQQSEDWYIKPIQVKLRIALSSATRNDLSC